MVKSKIIAVALLFAGVSAFAQVKPGIEVLRENGFKELQGKRVGLLTNPSGVDRELHSTIDILYSAPGVKLVKLFAPEHGVRGDIYAGGHADDTIDEATGLPVLSMYGKNMTPTPEMLEGLDVVVYDIQDVGTRSYTFISAMGLLMRACAENNVDVMVLDRPNPLGGIKVEGNYVEPGFFSYVSEFKIPYVYGLTPGEVALLINGEMINCGVKGDLEPRMCNLTVVPMKGWKRSMTYDKTGLPWILPSPQVPQEINAIGYPCAGIVGDFSSHYLNIGIGYTLPFQAFAAEWIDAEALKKTLDGYKLPGIAWRTIHYKPFFGDCQGKLLHGVQYFFTDYKAANLTLINFYVMQAIHELYPEHEPFGTKRDDMFDKVCGTSKVREIFSKAYRVDDVKEFWMKDVEEFRAISKKYYLYK
ncbi:MAG: DUF1343 domain-containing protein [Bacteroidales bacterium]|nr:DUF1343 domain-containing protein [Candidatus Cryptobacteroides fimicaballi]